jgi:hypothetical protein
MDKQEWGDPVVVFGPGQGSSLAPAQPVLRVLDRIDPASPRMAAAKI